MQIPTATELREDSLYGLVKLIHDDGTVIFDNSDSLRGRHRAPGRNAVDEAIFGLLNEWHDPGSNTSLDDVGTIPIDDVVIGSVIASLGHLASFPF
jgi:hypothetical protein